MNTQSARSAFRAVPSSQLFLVLGLSLLLLFAATGHAQISPSADAYISTATPSANHGADALLRVNGASDSTFIQFNLASVPPGAVVSQELRLCSTKRAIAWFRQLKSRSLKRSADVLAPQLSSGVRFVEILHNAIPIHGVPPDWDLVLVGAAGSR